VLRAGGAASCPRCNVSMTSRPIGGGSFGRGYARRRSWLIAGIIAALLAAPPPGSAGQAEETPAAPDSEVIQRAFAMWQQGYILHMIGDYAGAARQFRASIAAHPTAEGHTFLGWSLSHMGRIEEAIAECEKAIAIDPDYGNPYNDIGVYLIQLGRADEAIPWLEQAIAAPRYCCYHYAHTNLGRVLVVQGRLDEAEQSFRQALTYAPDYAPARRALDLLRERGTPL
jgi:Tfp pilus assembly protein PilF